ncbi:MAG: DinB family protein [Acidobacteriota bacterium]
MVAFLFREYSIRKLRQLRERLDVCLDLLTEEQIWRRGSEAENAVGNLVLHLAGNVRQWALSAVGGAADVRDRDAEFAARGGLSKAELRQRLAETVEAAIAVFAGLSEERLTEPLQVQGYDIPVLDAVYQVVDHFALHAGQIQLLTKLYTQQDLGFYAHLSLPAHGEPTP